MILSENDINRIIEMSWEDITPFDAIFMQFNLREDQVKELMKKKTEIFLLQIMERKSRKLQNKTSKNS